MAQRFLTTNLVTDSTSTLYASSEDAAHPLAWLRDQAPGKPWRSRTGWTFASWNGTGTYVRGILRSFTITAGHYSTPAAAAAAIVSALEAADPTPAWACSYDPVTHLFTISSDLAFAPQCLADGLGSPWVDIGFSVLANRASATSQAGDAANYQSRQYVAVYYPAGATLSGYMMAWAHAHGTGGVFYGGFGTSITNAISDANAKVPIATGGATHRIVALDPAGDTYFVLIISHGASTQGYCEIGNFFVGGYTAPTYSWTFTGYQREPQDLSGVEQAVSGAHVRTSRPVRNVWSVDWDALSEADMDVLRAIKSACPRGKNLWILFDPDDLTDVEYVTLDSGPSERLLSPTLYGPAATFAQVLP